MYSASVLLTVAMGSYWKKFHTTGTFASLIVARVLPLFAIFIKDASALLSYLQWLASDKDVAIATYILSLTALIAISLLPHKLLSSKLLTYPNRY